MELQSLPTDVKQLNFDGTPFYPELEAPVTLEKQGFSECIGDAALYGVSLAQVKLADTYDYLKREGGKIAAHAALAGLALVGAAGLMAKESSTADAAAYAGDVRAPGRSGGTLTAWASVSSDCSGTLGCWNYEKIEKKNPNPLEVWEPWLYVGGRWVYNNGWNSVTANLPAGCGDYRTTVDSYNYVTGDQGGGVNMGPVGVSGNGQMVYEYHTHWNSGTNHYCK